MHICNCCKIQYIVQVYLFTLLIFKKSCYYYLYFQMYKIQMYKSIVNIRIRHIALRYNGGEVYVYRVIFICICIHMCIYTYMYII